MNPESSQDARRRLLVRAIAKDPKAASAARRRLLVMVIAACAIVGALLYMAPWKGPGTAEVVAATTTAKVAEVSPATPGGGAPNFTDEVALKNGSANTRPLTAEERAALEKAAVDRQIRGVEAEAVRLKRGNRKRFDPAEDNTGRRDFVTVDSFTDEQLAVFDAFLAKQGQVFPAGSPAALAYRKRAEGVVSFLRQYPRMAVSKFTPKPSGPPAFVIYHLTPDAPFPVMENGIVTATGKHMTRIMDSGENPAMEEYFADIPGTK